MATTTKTLYDTDFVEWTARTAQLVREGRFDEVDLANLAEEIEDLGKGDRSAVRSQLIRMLMHLVKQHIQPERSGSSWRTSIMDGRNEILTKLEDSPSLRHHLAENLQKIYQRAVRSELEETSSNAEVPAKCPYTLDELLDGNLNALQKRSW